MIRVAITSELSEQPVTPLPIILAATFLTGNCSSKIVHGAFSSNSRLDVREVKTESVRALRRYFIVRNTVKEENLDVWPLSVENEALLTCNFTS